MRDLYADLALCERATPGPWEARKQSDGWWVRKLPNDIAVAEIYTEYDGDDAIFIAESREGWPHAIRRVIEVEKKVERLRREIERLRNRKANDAERAVTFWRGGFLFERERKEKLRKAYEKSEAEIDRLRKALYAVYALVLDAEADEIADIIVDALGGFELMERYRDDAIRGEKLYREICEDTV